MPNTAVLTGDLINSTRVANGREFRGRLQLLLTDMESKYNAKTSTYRGDGFQVTLTGADHVFEAAIYLRAGLLAKSPDKAERWDARIAMSVGNAGVIAAAGVIGVAESSNDDQNSPVFIESGRALDAMEKERMTFVGEPEFLLVAAGLATAFIDELINDWTPVEAEAVFEYLQTRDSHQLIAERLGKTRPTVTQTLQRARYGLVERYLKDMQRLLELRNEW